jgi:hypothetical protein
MPCRPQIREWLARIFGTILLVGSFVMYAQPPSSPSTPLLLLLALPRSRPRPLSSNSTAPSLHRLALPLLRPVPPSTMRSEWYYSEVRHS